MASRRSSSYLSFLVLTLLLSACAGHSVAPVSEPGTSRRAASAPDYHVVKIGETLYSISSAHGYDYRQVASWNGIERPYRIYPGQRLRFRPPAGIKNNKTRGALGSSTKHAQKVPQPQYPAGAQREKKADEKPLKWRWPTEGTLVRTYSANDSGKKGIAIAGRAGQPVHAAAKGDVVYSGGGLLRYGNLIIIKHSHTYFSAYAHNRKLLVKEGDRVQAGQAIAEMGSTGTNQNILHFEIRRNGRPVDPLPYLQKR